MKNKKPVRRPTARAVVFNSITFKAALFAGTLIVLVLLITSLALSTSAAQTKDKTEVDFPKLELSIETSQVDRVISAYANQPVYDLRGIIIDFDDLNDGGQSCSQKFSSLTFLRPRSKRSFKITLPDYKLDQTPYLKGYVCFRAVSQDGQVAYSVRRIRINNFTVSVTKQNRQGRYYLVISSNVKKIEVNYRYKSDLFSIASGSPHPPNFQGGLEFDSYACERDFNWQTDSTSSDIQRGHIQPNQSTAFIDIGSWQELEGGQYCLEIVNADDQNQTVYVYAHTWADSIIHDQEGAYLNLYLHTSEVDEVEWSMVKTDNGWCSTSNFFNLSSSQKRQFENWFRGSVITEFKADDNGQDLCLRAKSSSLKQVGSLPDNWSQLSAAEKIRLNPWGCHDLTKIRADNGRCLSGGGLSQVVMPDNWSQLSAAEKIRLNPWGCHDLTKIRADNGRCLSGNGYRIDGTVYKLLEDIDLSPPEISFIHDVDKKSLGVDITDVDGIVRRAKIILVNAGIPCSKVWQNQLSIEEQAWAYILTQNFYYRSTNPDKTSFYWLAPENINLSQSTGKTLCVEAVDWHINYSFGSYTIP